MNLNNEARGPDIAWKAVLIGYGISVAGTLLLGGSGFLLANMGAWWVANWGLGSLLVGGMIAGFWAKTSEPLNGALIAAIYFATTMFIIFLSEFLGVLPDPLPGLPRGDSTFFFVWPLEQLVAATLGTVLGGWFFAKWKKPS